MPAPDSLVAAHRGVWSVGTFLVDRGDEVGAVRGVETILVLVVLGTVVAAFAGRLHVPAPALLVMASVVAGLLPGVRPGRSGRGAAAWRRAVRRAGGRRRGGGGVLAAGVVLVRERIIDPVLETVIALVTPYAAYVLGQALHVSPVMAVIVAGRPA